jgi:hypothetical protein
MTDPARLVDFYRRCRLENQRNFYRSRSEEFGAAADQAAILAAILLGLTGIVSALATGEWGGKTALTILAIALPALSTALAGYAALYAFEQQQKLYRDALRALGKQAAVQPDDPAAYAETVEEILAREQAQWGQVVAEIKPAGGG